MILRTPTRYRLVAGSAEGPTPLNAFDGALLEAGIGDVNLVKVSSILPPACVAVEELDIPYGSLVPVAYASFTSDLPGEVIAAAVAVAIPEDETRAGLIMEYSARGHQEEAEDIVRRMARQGLERRSLAIRAIVSTSIQHRVERIGAAFAAVVLWDDGGAS